ncbi:MAG: formate dehydrogenase accessory sulfurtransferase FdhD [Campylobacteraceae bacterium]|nr:formate dehydrogenase accessory sulfurtransferase FdhD [Campylobacteraceae bacterium]
MEPTFTTEITKIKDGKKFTANDTLVREIKLEIIVNGERIGAVMATPVDQEALALGYLMSENIIASFEDISSMELINEGMGVDIKAIVNQDNIGKLNAEGVVISGCGRSVTANIDPDAIEAKVIQNPLAINASLLSTQMSQFYTECPLYEQTGCVHTAKLFIDEKTFFIGEDIAQHNTIDKAIGKARLAGADVSKAFLMVSGRLSSEMVAKAVMHEIPILVSRTASTCLGLMIAKKFNLTLVGFARNERMNIYNAPERIHV